MRLTAHRLFERILSTAPRRILIRPVGGRDINLDGLYTRLPHPSFGNPYFSFTRKAHRELSFQDVGELINFVKSSLAEVHQRTHAVKKGEMREYVAQRLKEGDPEWIKYCGSAQKGQKWKKWALTAS